MIVRFLGPRVRQPMKHGRLGLPIRIRLVLVRIAMDQLSVLDASAMLDQEHMAAARTLQDERKQRRQGASTSNHSEFGEVSLRGGHGCRGSMSEAPQISICR